LGWDKLIFFKSPVIQSRPVNIEIRKITQAKKPKSIDSQLLNVPNPVKPQVYANKYDSVISLDVGIFIIFNCEF